MEIKRYIDIYKKHPPKKFYEWLSEGRTMEIRFLSDFKGNKFTNWQLIRTLSELFNLEYRFNSLYINSYEELKAILFYKIPLINKSYVLTALYNIFISVNPKRKVFVQNKQGLLYKSYYGGIAGTSHIQTILADIEHIGERKGNATEAMLEECLEGALYLIKLLKINNYYINISGNGVHLYMKLENPIELPIPDFYEGPKGIKYKLKEEPIYSLIKTYNKYIEKLNKYLNEFNPKLKVDDGAKDISRIARPTGSWNIKIGKTARAVGTIYSTEVKDSTLININNKSFMAVRPAILNSNKSIRKTAKLTNKHRYNKHNIVDSPLFQLLINGLLPSTLSRNHYLEQSFARLLNDNSIAVEDIPELVEQMDVAQQKNVQVDPDYLDGDEIFNPEQVNNYCYACKISLVYEIMEDVPNIKEGFITEEQHQQLNDYSIITVNALARPELSRFIGKYKTLLDVKMSIRNMVDDGYSKTDIFFAIKKGVKDEWTYLFENKIVQQILNKTRRRIK